MRTPGEAFTVTWRGAPAAYRAAWEWIDPRVPSGALVLDVGSPPFVVEGLRARGRRVVQADVRRGPTVALLADGCALPVRSASVDAATSVCVLCHAGTGRYGEAGCVDGWRRMLREASRVLREGGLFVSQLGPVWSGATLHDGDWHRVVHWPSVAAECAGVGLQVLEAGIWREAEGRWLGPGEPAAGTCAPAPALYDYGAVAARRAA